MNNVINKHEYVSLAIHIKHTQFTQLCANLSSVDHMNELPCNVSDLCRCWLRKHNAAWQLYSNTPTEVHCAGMQLT